MRRVLLLAILFLVPGLLALSPAPAAAARLSGELGGAGSEEVAGRSVHLYAFEPQIGAVVTVELTAEEFDPVLFLISPAGERHFNDDYQGDRGRSRLQVLAGVPGQWVAVVTSYSGGERGAYQLSVTPARIVEPAALTPALREVLEAEMAQSLITAGEGGEGAGAQEAEEVPAARRREAEAPREATAPRREEAAPAPTRRPAGEGAESRREEAAPAPAQRPASRRRAVVREVVAPSTELRRSAGRRRTEVVTTTSAGTRVHLAPTAQPRSAIGQALRRRVEAPADFPWPPVSPSASLVLPRHRLAARSLGAVDGLLARVLATAGYRTRRYFGVPGGFALVTRLERIEADGAPKPYDERWEESVAPVERFDLGTYISALYRAPVGYYRTFVFVVSPVPLDREAPSTPDANGWSPGGQSELPAAVARRSFTSAYTVTALVYEFEQRRIGEDGTVAFKSERLAAQTHLAQARILASLRR